MKRVPWSLIITIVVVGCIIGYLWKGSSPHLEKVRKGQPEGANELRQKREGVMEMASRYGAVTDWDGALKRDVLERVYTFQVQDTLKNGAKPVLGFGSVEDIARYEGGFHVYFRGMKFLTEKPDIRFVLEATPQQVESILKQKPTFVDEYAVIADVASVERPAFEAKLESEESGESHISIDSADVFYVVRGRCLDLMFVGSLRVDEHVSSRKTPD